MGLKGFPQRGEIYLVCLDPTIGSKINKTRPALIISNDIGNQAARTVTVIPVTSRVDKIYPFEALLSSSESGLVKDSKAKCSQVRSIDKKRLIKRVGRVSDRKLKDVEEALLVHLGIM